MPIHDGFIVSDAIVCNNLAGRDLSFFLENIFTKSGFSFTTAKDRRIVQNLKEALCCVALDFDAAAASDSSPSKSFQLPDGQPVVLSAADCARCPEALFHPSLVGWEFGGIHEAAYSAVMKCDPAIRPALLANIVLEGASTMFPGFTERLQRELTTLVGDAAMEVVVTAPANRAHSAWSGAADFASLPAFSQLYITRDEYDEIGPNVVRTKWSSVALPRK